MSQPLQAPAPQQPQQLDPNVLQQMLQQLAASGALPGYTLTKDPEPPQPLGIRQFLTSVVAHLPWRTEEMHNAMQAAAHSACDVIDQLQQDLAHIHARLGLYAQPLTASQATVQAQQGLPVPAVAPAPLSPPLQPAAPPAPLVPAGGPQFGPTGVPLAPPVGPMPAPTAPAYATFQQGGLPYAPPAPPAPAPFAPGSPGVPAR